MKKYFRSSFIILIIVFSIGLICGCDKKSAPPEFTLLSSKIIVINGSDTDTVLQFYATCTNEAINMSKAIVTDPIDSQSITFMINGTLYSKNQRFDLQGTNQGYLLRSGKWKINLSGTGNSDGVGFDVVKVVEVN